MAIRTWPPNLQVGAADYGVEYDVQLTVTRNGRIYTYGLPGGRWVATITFSRDFEQLSRPLTEALITSLEGGAHRLSMPHFGRPIPNGTMRGSPRVGSTLAAGSKSIQVANADGSLRAGDIIGLPRQFVMVLQDTTPFATNMTVQVSPAVREQHNSGTPIVWNRPTALWIPRSSTAGPYPYMPKERPSFSVELVEAWA